MKDSSDKECKDGNVISIVILYKTGPVRKSKCALGRDCTFAWRASCVSTCVFFSQPLTWYHTTLIKEFTLHK